MSGNIGANPVNERHPDRRLIFTSTINQNVPFEPEVKRQAVMALCTRHEPASEIARNIGISRTVLYKWKDEIIGDEAYQSMCKHEKPSLTEERDTLREEVNRLNQELWLSPSARMLRYKGQRLSEKVVRRLMVEEQLVVSRNRRRRYSSYCGEIGPAPDNLLARDFNAEKPNQKWLTDITEFQLPSGKVWLSPVIDCFDGKVVSWSLSTRPDAELVNTMLDNVLGTLNAGECPVIHSDRGGHYRWPGWLERVNAAGLIRSMSRKGCSPDNAACEGFFGRLKNEMYYGREWSGITPENFMQHVDAYIRWYNERRIKLSLGAVSPEMYRRRLGITY